jgi:hypothetical protein
MIYLRLVFYCLVLAARFCSTTYSLPWTISLLSPISTLTPHTLRLSRFSSRSILGTAQMYLKPRNCCFNIIVDSPFSSDSSSSCDIRISAGFVLIEDARLVEYHVPSSSSKLTFSLFTSFIVLLICSYSACLLRHRLLLQRARLSNRVCPLFL